MNVQCNSLWYTESHIQWLNDILSQADLLKNLTCIFPTQRNRCEHRGIKEKHGPSCAGVMGSGAEAVFHRMNIVGQGITNRRCPMEKLIHLVSFICIVCWMERNHLPKHRGSFQMISIFFSVFISHLSPLSIDLLSSIAKQISSIYRALEWDFPATLVHLKSAGDKGSCF